MMLMTLHMKALELVLKHEINDNWDALVSVFSSIY